MTRNWLRISASWEVNLQYAKSNSETSSLFSGTHFGLTAKTGLLFCLIIRLHFQERLHGLSICSTIIKVIKGFLFTHHMTFTIQIMLRCEQQTLAQQLLWRLDLRVWHLQAEQLLFPLCKMIYPVAFVSNTSWNIVEPFDAIESLHSNRINESVCISSTM